MIEVKADERLLGVFVPFLGDFFSITTFIAQRT